METQSCIWLFFSSKLPHSISMSLNSKPCDIGEHLWNSSQIDSSKSYHENILYCYCKIVDRMVGGVTIYWRACLNDCPWLTNHSPTQKENLKSLSYPNRLWNRDGSGHQMHRSADVGWTLRISGRRKLEKKHVNQI